MDDETESSSRSQGLTATLDVAGDAAVNGIECSLRCHIGGVRTENQDRVGRSVISHGELVVVADGVGGGAGGALAATIAVEEYVKLRLESEEEPESALRRVTKEINRRIAALRQHDPALSGMASTVALVLIQERTLYAGHLGDSRVYLGHAGVMRLLTRDHSVVRRMVDDGIITEEEARTHPSGHILSQSLGQEGAELEVSAVELETGDTVLICSDGLWAYVAERNLAEALTSADLNVAVAADALLDQALAAGAPDNISVALLRIGLVRPVVALPVLKTKTSSTRRTVLIVCALILVVVIVWLLAQTQH